MMLKKIISGGQTGADIFWKYLVEGCFVFLPHFS